MRPMKLQALKRLIDGEIGRRVAQGLDDDPPVELQVYRGEGCSPVRELAAFQLVGASVRLVSTDVPRP